ncbi:DEAD/DEAH box helicase domain [Trinorchestia longiramus]|nr:DEAD/DEAH box helicase domain [Trinorchestia longiramus]
MVSKRPKPDAGFEDAGDPFSKRKRKKNIEFLADLGEDEEQMPREDKKKLASAKLKREKKNFPGLSANVVKYIRGSANENLDQLIIKYLKKHKIPMIDGVRDEVAANTKVNKGAVRVKLSEMQRLERLKRMQQIAPKLDEEQKNVEEYFKDSVSIDTTRTFESMHLHEHLMLAIKKMDYTEPTPIQSATIPVAMAGKDVCGCAATGTGKTAAYLLPVLERLLQLEETPVKATRVLVLVPTRELGVQVFEVCRNLTKYTKIRSVLVAAGMRSNVQWKEVLDKPDIIIATPGQLLKGFANLKEFTLEHVEVLILDEADRILDNCFQDQMQLIIKNCSPKRQTLLFSATMTTEVKQIATAALNEPVKIFINSNTKVAQNLRQEYIPLSDGSYTARNAVLVYLLVHVFTNNVIVFLPSKDLCHRLYVTLRLCGLAVAELHGKLTQSCRLHNLALFSSGKVRVLLATDLAARGLDIQGVDIVVNYKLSSSYSMYVHRVGRTARAGREGLAISLVPDSEYRHLKAIRKMSQTVVYLRKIDTQAVQEWQDRLEKLYSATQEILLTEQEGAKEKEIGSIKERLEKMEEKRRKHEEKMKEHKKYAELRDEINQTKKISAIAATLGMTVKGYLMHKRMETLQVSNSKKKRLGLLEERKKDPTLKMRKKKSSLL